MSGDLSVWFREQLEAHALVWGSHGNRAFCKCGAEWGDEGETSCLRLHRAHVGEVLASGLEQVGWQWVDDGIADGGLVRLDTMLEGDTRLKPVFRVVVLPHPKETR